jgi:hypothetical protein
MRTNGNRAYQRDRSGGQYRLHSSAPPSQFRVARR